MTFKLDGKKNSSSIKIPEQEGEDFKAIPKKIEQEKIPEKESASKKEVEAKQTEANIKSKRLPQLLPKKIKPIPQVQDELTIKIEKILESGLDESYQRLSPIAKQEFKIKGEQTALKIRDLLKSSRVKLKKILKLILDWLRMLPGVNRFFLEQEAKIKADKIITLKK